MANNKKIVSDEKAEEWKNLYEEGYGQYDLVAHESAKGECTSWDVIKREIVRVGGKLRSFNDTIKMRDARRVSRNS